MVVDVEKLSDAEIRTKLMEYGFPVMPITGTTRKLMVKKLKFLLDSKKKPNDRKSLGQFSSEEESDTDVTSSKKNKSRRVTMGAPLVTNRSKGIPRKSVRDNDITNDLSIDAPATKRVVTTTTTKVTKTVQDEFDTGSDSDLEIIPHDNELPSTVTNSFDKRDSGKSYNSIASSSRYVSPRASSAASSTYASRSNLPSTYLSSVSPSTNLDNLQQIRSRLSLGSPGFDRPLSTSSPQEKVETPYLSDFAHRLSKLSPVSPRSKYDYKNDVIKEHDTNGAGSYGRRPARYREVNDYYPQHKSNILKDNWVSISLFGAAIVFFLAVSIMYWGMRNDGSALDTVDYIIPNCDEYGPTAKEGINCLYDKDVASAIKLMKILKPELTKLSISYACRNALTKPFMTEDEIIKFQHQRTSESTIDIRRHLTHLEVLILKNPDWGISLIPSDSLSEIDKDDVLKTIDQVITTRSGKDIGLVVLNVDLPWHCVLFNKFYEVLNVISVLLAVFIIVYVANYLYNWYQKRQQRKKEELGKLIDQIIEALQTNSDEDYLVINHVRDMILPFKDRQRLAVLWDEAVKIINENDSRVRCETQNVQGEVFRVWRWLGSASLNASCSPRSKTWQGQAFETQQGSVNSLPFSPTPCLKIRGMVDDNEENYAIIKEAVLSKCAHECRILHCGVDKTSKCVYLKCSDQKQAAVAYQNLHGWWYAGHLVTVKYLRLERYMQRFPESPATGPPFLQASLPATD